MKQQFKDYLIKQGYSVTTPAGNSSTVYDYAKRIDKVCDRKGDTVVVESISRFARNTKDLLGLIDKLTEKGVEFVSQKESIDTSTPTGKFMLTVFGAVAELERSYMLQRQAEGIAIAKKEGKYKGRKKIVNNNFGKVYKDWKAGYITAVRAMTLLGMKRNTFYRRVAEYEQAVSSAGEDRLAK